MGINVIDVAPQRHRSIGRRLVAALGLLLMVAGILLSGAVLLVVILVVVFGLASGDLTLPAGRMILVTMAASAVGIGLWIIGVKLMRGRPRTVLFLRKFGFGEAKLFVSHAASEALGRRWRLVTLDDLAIQPVTTPRLTRWIVRLLVLALIALAAYLLYVAFQTAANPDSSAVERAMESAAEDADNPVGAVVGALVVGMVMALIVAIVTGMVVVAISLLAGAAAIFGLASLLTSRSLARAERQGRTPVRNPGELAAFLHRIHRARRKLFAPRIAVVRVVDELWKDAVAGLAAQADVVLLDISDPSESLQWEVQMLQRLPEVTLLPIGSADRVRALAATGGHDHDDRVVLHHLDRRDVLVYGTDRKAFARELRHMLETARPS